MEFQFNKIYSLNSKFKKFGCNIILSTLACLIFLPLNSQTIGRSQISSLGSTNSSSGITFLSAVGQGSLVTFENSNSIVLGQGFIQPSFFNGTKSELEINIYPNPNNGTFYLKPISDKSELLSYQLFDSFGNLIRSGESIPNTLINIQISSIATGIYILKIIQNNAQLTKKISILN